MQSIFFTGLVLFLSFSAHGEVKSFLKPDPIIIIVQGQDSDARRLFDSIDVSKTEVSNSVFQKKIESPSGQILFTCLESVNTQSVSCTIKVRRDENLEVLPEKKRAYLATYLPEDTEYLFSKFVKNSEGLVPMYVSEKQDFAYSSAKNRFILSYQEVSN